MHITFSEIELNQYDFQNIKKSINKYDCKIYN